MLTGGHDLPTVRSLYTCIAKTVLKLALLFIRFEEITKYGT